MSYFWRQKSSIHKWFISGEILLHLVWDKPVDQKSGEVDVPCNSPADGSVVDVLNLYRIRHILQNLFILGFLTLLLTDPGMKATSLKANLSGQARLRNWFQYLEFKNSSVKITPTQLYQIGTIQFIKDILESLKVIGRKSGDKSWTELEEQNYQHGQNTRVQIWLWKSWIKSNL